MLNTNSLGNYLEIGISLYKRLCTDGIQFILTASLGSGGPSNSFDGHDNDDDDEGTGIFENTIKTFNPNIEIA